MASFPEISALDFSLVSNPDGDSLIQSPVQFPDFEFQHTSNFDYYKPCSLDFYFLDSPINRYAVLRSDLASCYWESLKMKCRYILAAATGWDSESNCALPTAVPEAKLLEIGMTAPPFPLIHQLTYNFLLLPERPEKIREWICLWQSNSLQLAAWIAQAKVQSKKLPSCSWRWPATPLITYPTSTLPISPLASPVTNTNTEEGDVPVSNSSVITDTEALFGECPEPPSECGTLILSSHQLLKHIPTSGRVAHALHANSEKGTLKRARDSSPVDPLHDGEKDSKRQLVLWRPTIAKVLEMEANLRRGEVSCHSNSSNPISSIRVRDPRLGTPNTFPSRRDRKPRLDLSLLTADLSDVSDGSSASSSMDGLF